MNRKEDDMSAQKEKKKLGFQNKFFLKKTENDFLPQNFLYF